MVVIELLKLPIQNTISYTYGTLKSAQNLTPTAQQLNYIVTEADCDYGTLF